MATRGLLRRYVYGVRRISMTSGNSTSYYIYDTLGSVANLTSTSGAMQRTWSYEPFGASRTETNAKGKQPDNPMKFAGEYLDPTGFYHLRARQYNPGGGRFLSQDPLQLTTGQEALVSGHIYASDLPTALSDPSGMGAVSIGSPGLWAALDVVSGVDVDNPGFVCELRGCLPSRRGPWLVYPFPDSVQKRAVKRSSGMVDVHPTLGLPGYPAIDFVASAGTRVLAVQEGKIDGWSGHDPRLGPIQGIHGPFGWSIYLRAKSGSRYYYTHLAMRTRSPGDRVRTGQMVGTVGNYSRWGGLDHLHLGVNGGPVSIMMVFRAPQVTGTR
jgi:RHS repeat-associated protein